jgi:hypothetical protein
MVGANVVLVCITLTQNYAQTHEKARYGQESLNV